MKYRAKHYVPQATIVTVAGAFGEKDIAKRIENIFRF